MIITAICSTSHHVKTRFKEKLLKSAQFKSKTLEIISLKNFDLYIDLDLGQQPYKIFTTKTNNVMVIGQIFGEIEGLQTKLEEGYEDITDFVINRCYGSYLIFQYHDDVLEIARDPVGQLPIFYSEHKGDFYLSNEISLLEQLQGRCFSYNWNYIASFALYTFITSDSTAFNEVSELPHGCKLTVSIPSFTCTTDVLWDPRPFCYKERHYTSYHDLNIVDKLSTIIAEMLGENTAKVMLDFSGGLDSSSLLLILGDILKNSRQIHALNMFHPDVASSDERQIASKLSDYVGSNFIEFNHAIHLPISPVDNLELKPNWPTANLEHLKIERDISQLAKQLNVDYFVSGHGGDHIFLCQPPIEAIYDYYYLKGTRSLSNHAEEISSMGRIPMSKIALSNMKAAIKHKLGIRYNRDSIFYDDTTPWINANIVKMSQDIKFHPLFDLDMSSLLPGKFSQLDNIISGLASIKSNLRTLNTPIMYPLFSQPMIELCLTIPTFESYKEGYGRYILRQSIANKFGYHKNIWRKDKGETTGITQIAMQKNRDYVLGLCLDGYLMQSGFLDKQHKNTIYKALQDMMGGKPDLLWPIHNLITLEIFFQLWQR